MRYNCWAKFTQLGGSRLRKIVPDLLFLFLVAGVIILADQATKYWIETNLAMSEIYRPDLWISQYVRIVNWKNYGAAFGIFQNLGGVFTVLSFLVSLAIIYYFPQVPRQDWLVRVSMSMLLGGAVGNLIDRLRQGYVTDFISVGDFPVFNIADASISTGVVVLFVAMWLQERNQRRTEANEPPESLSAPEE
jgi:signal peptidase II